MKRLKIAHIVVALMLMVGLASLCLAQAAPVTTPPDEKAVSGPGSTAPGFYAIGLCVILIAGALGTAMAQKAIGTAVVGAVAEDRKLVGVGLILLALPETILFICAGFAYLLFGKLP